MIKQWLYIVVVIGPLLVTGQMVAQETTVDFYFGSDLSYVQEMEDCGAEFRENGVPKDVVQIFADNGNNLCRLRLWHTPDWTDYSNFEDVKSMISRAKSAGMVVCLDYHYSDTWADPGKQHKPAAWNGLSFEVLRDSVYQYTFNTLSELDNLGLLPEFVQVGNEIDPGFIWPDGQLKDYTNQEWQNFGTLLNEGIRAVRDVSAGSEIETKIIIHKAGEASADWWFSRLTTLGGVVDFDVIGISYYHWWTEVELDGLQQILHRLRLKYRKEVMVVEAAYPFTFERADNCSNICSEAVDGYPATPEGQKAYVSDLIQGIADAGGTGIMYWEPAWVSTNCSTPWCTGSSWENVTFFDFRNNNEILPVFESYQRDYSKPFVFKDLDIPLNGVEDGDADWGDYDNDGDMDLIITGRSDLEDETGTVIYQNNGDGTFTSLPDMVVGVSSGSVKWADIDLDDDLDIAIAGQSEEGKIAKIYRNEGANQFVNTGMEIDPVSNAAIDWIDYDNDHDPDLIVTGWGSTSETKFYRNDGGSSLIEIDMGFKGVSDGALSWGDYDNDGDPDLLLSGWNQSLQEPIAKVYRNDGADTFTELSTGIIGVSQGSAVWGDYDQDGDLDILISGWNAYGNAAKIYQNKGDEVFRDVAILPGLSQCSAQWIDLDLDNDLDVVMVGYFSKEERLYSGIHVNNGNNTFIEQESNIVRVSPSSMDVADFDKDGQPDLLLTGNGISVIYQNQYDLVQYSPEHIIPTDQTSFRFYPNPANNLLTIELNQQHNSEPQEICLINTRGETVFQITSTDGILTGNQFTMELPDLPQGLYLLQLWNRGKSTTGKLIIH